MLTFEMTESCASPTNSSTPLAYDSIQKIARFSLYGRRFSTVYMYQQLTAPLLIALTFLMLSC